MKRVIIGLVVLLVSYQGYAGLRGSPFQPHDDQRFNEIEGGDSAASSREGLGSKSHVAIANWDYSLDGTSSAVGDYDLGVTLPANATITRGYMYAVNAATSTHTSQHEPTLALKCGSVSLMSAQQLALRVPTDDYFHDIVTGLSATFVSIPTKCNLTATVATGEFTGGKMQFILEFVVRQ